MNNTAQQVRATLLLSKSDRWMYNKIREVDEVAAEDFLKIIMENPQPYDSDYERCYYRRNAAYYLNQRFYWQPHKPTWGNWSELFDKLRQNQYGGHNQ